MKLSKAGNTPTRKKSSEKTQERSIFAALPAVFLLTLWPCLVRMESVRNYAGNVTWFPPLGEVTDFFMHVRSISLLLLAVVMLLIIVDQGIVKRERILYPRVMWPMVGYILMIIISTALSVNRAISLHGLLEQYESIWVLLAYMVVFWYFLSVVPHAMTWRQTAACLQIGATIQCMIGFSQILHKDVVESLLRLLTHEDLVFAFNEGANPRAYLTFYNPNYAAVYLAMMIPVVLCGILYFEQRWQQIYSGALGIGLLICLWGTGSKTGFPFLIVVAFLGVFFALKSQKARILAGSIFLAALVAVIALVFLKPDMPVLNKMIKNFPNRQHPFIQEIRLEDDAVVLQCSSDTYRLSFKNTNGKSKPVCIDSEGRYVELCEAEDGFQKLEAYQKADLKFRFSDHGELQIDIGRKGQTLTFISKEIGEPFYYRNAIGKLDTIANAPTAFDKSFDGELTGRVYLWNRSIPLLRHYGLFGGGPDTFPFIFPQNDYLGRTEVGKYLVENILTRPHSFYLQQAVQTGLPSLIFLLILFAKRSCSSLSIALTDTDPKRSAWKRAVFLGIAAFLLMGITNDSVVVVTPLFYALLAL